jgi:hypothetical protein
MLFLPWNLYGDITYKRSTSSSSSSSSSSTGIFTYITCILILRNPKMHYIHG